MKLSLSFILLICFASIPFGSTITMKEASEAFFLSIRECKSMIPVVGDEIIQKFISNNPILSKDEKCFIACVMQKLYLMNDNGYMVKGTFMDGLDLMIPDDPVKRQIGAEIITSCELVHDNDICESAAAIGQCMNDGKQARGLTMIF